jgi:Luciferase-like monooxygenase
MNSPKPDLGRIGIWAGDLDRYPVAGVRAAARAIDDLGYGTLWFPETTGREAMTQGGILLSATRRITVAAGAARAYVAKRTATGNSRREIMRLLQRYIARELYPLIIDALVPATPAVLT